jgi:hypothetical protein
MSARSEKGRDGGSKKGRDSGKSSSSDDTARRIRAESRWPAVVGIVIALVLYGALPSDFPTALRVVVVALGLILLIPVVVLNPRVLGRETRWSRILSVAQALLLVAANQLALGILIHILVTATQADGPAVLLAAVQVWGTNIIAFGLLFWELDRGGPVARRLRARKEVAQADFRFPQDEDSDAVVEVAARSSDISDWMPGYIDYAYFSLSNSMAFSPTDVMPLSSRAKLLMGLEAVAAFVILALVIARAVSLLD